MIIDADGAVDVPESRIAELARAIIESRSGADTFGSDGGEVSFPYFISPEQAMRERSELARKGIARAKSVVALAYAGGVLFVAENPSRSLQKISELYDRVGLRLRASSTSSTICAAADPVRRHPRLRL